MKKILIVIIIFYCTGCASQRHASRGWDHLKNHEYNKALAEFNTAQKSRDIPGTYLGQYRTYMGMKQEARALDSLKKGLAAHPDDGFLNWSMADFLTKRKNDPCTALQYLYKTQQSRVGSGTAAKMLKDDISNTQARCNKITFASAYKNHSKVFAEFNRQLRAVNLKCYIPAGFAPHELNESGRKDVNYYYAVKHQTEKIEVRYSIFPWSKSDSGGINSSSSFLGFTICVIENISGTTIKKTDKFSEIKADVVKKVFNADSGYMAVVNPKSDFGKGYNRAMIIGLFKKDTGLSYHTILFDEEKISDINFQPLFYSVRFNDKK